MNDSEVLGLLIYANELDGRHSPNEAKVYAWQEVLQEGAPDLTLAFARDCIRKHYATLDTMITPATIVTAWGRHRRVTNDLRLGTTVNDPDAHCGIGGCSCTHSNPCYRGWIDRDWETSPCPRCRPRLAMILGKIPPPGSRQAHDWTLLRTRETEPVT